jgi:hypothetical protein
MACPPKKAKARGVPQVGLRPRVDQKVSCPSSARNIPSGVEVIIRLLAPKQPEAPRRVVASSFSSWSRVSKSSSNVVRDSEMLASWRSVAKLRRPSRDRLHESSDWNESNPRKVVAALDEVALKADSSVLVADPRIDKSSRSSTNLSRLL